VYWIARESIANALRHSNGSSVHIALQYQKDGFRLSVRDDGRGIDWHTLQTGRENHFGLVGMSERARNIRGTLNVSSALGAGTEVVLTLPASAAFDGK
jgi:signal transduction histidine kinase